MASKSTQAISTKKSKQTTAKSNSEPSGHVTRSMARNQPTTFVDLPSNPRELVITLANLADKHASRSEGKRASRSEEKETPNKSREQSFSPATNDETSTASYDRSPNDDEDHTYDMPADHSS